MNAKELKAALAVRYCAPEAAIFFEVADATGARQSGYTDAVSMNLWPSRGLLLQGFELKATRSDWLKELKKPAKAEAVFGYVDRWWLVAGDASIVKPGELPSTWGLLVAEGGRLVAKVEAPKLKPKPIPRGFLAAILRRAQESAVKPGEKALAQARDAGYTAGCEHGKLEAERSARQLLKIVEAFEEEIGQKLDRYSEWRNHGLGKAVRLALALGKLNVPLAVDVMETQAQAILEAVREIRAAGAAEQLRPPVLCPGCKLALYDLAAKAGICTDCAEREGRPFCVGECSNRIDPESALAPYCSEGCKFAAHT